MPPRSGPGAATAKKPPNCSQKPSTKAKEAISDDNAPAPKKKKPVVKAKPGCKKELELLDSSDEEQAMGKNDGGSDVGDNADDKVG